MTALRSHPPDPLHVLLALSLSLFRSLSLCVDDKKLGGVLKKLAFTEMKGMEEVNIFKDDGTVIHIKTPKSTWQATFCPPHALAALTLTPFCVWPCAVQMSVPSNTYVVSGPAETKKMEDLLPGILNQLGPESMDRLRDFATSQYGASAGAGAGAADEEEEDDDDVPDLVENFEVRFCLLQSCPRFYSAHPHKPPQLSSPTRQEAAKK